jgi:NADPH:quinone reductase-like Zn-dependent oxidoreductase
MPIERSGSSTNILRTPLSHCLILQNVKLNQGDDVGGIVEAVGAKVKNFRKGDRVAGFHEMDTPRGTYAEYTVCPAHTVFHIPSSMSFEEAATIPLAGELFLNVTNSPVVDALTLGKNSFHCSCRFV